MPTQADLIASLPSHLRAFARMQDYTRYTPRDHAVWRFCLHRLTEQLAETAHEVYREGLRQTGISLEQVPNIDDMNDALEELGWQAVVVDGFIPPSIFMEFQARRILVIAQDMRAVEHILYTPAPDIVHESAGHAPFIVDIDYAEYLQRFGEIGMKAIASADDERVFEAIRQLSIIKQDATASPAAIAAAQAELDASIAANTRPSEATRLARLHWWTVEYGLVGKLDDYRLFGAGLLSSLGESLHCLDDVRVPKHDLTVDVVDQSYDITAEQPQLFVTRSCKHMSQVLEEFAASMSFMRGGASALGTAIESGAICTAQYNSGLQVSGLFTQMHTDAVGHVTYLSTTGPSQLAYKDKELSGHSTRAHAQGFGSPVGHLKELPHCLSGYSVDELKAAGIYLHKPCRLEFLSGITVSGTLDHILRQDHRNLVMSFSNCTVLDRHGTVLFQPQWGTYDMAVGARINSVYGGVADRNLYQLYAGASNTQMPAPPIDAALMSLYEDIRKARVTGSAGLDMLTALHKRAGSYPDEWLLRVEVLELLNDKSSPLADRLKSELQAIAQRNPDTSALIALGLAGLAATAT